MMFQQCGRNTICLLFKVFFFINTLNLFSKNIIYIKNESCTLYSG